ncbi:MBL fold metallo-hydrolase [Hirschia baltica]|uniref:Beta-lactamase domain protein n=1 Tax=Hirschia baltica (strain ATCC 49814 / DSM 5838 / IFAM 1418) TaxID=582402 RepID=C6XI46_HIRBI|nr:MBL fold metallo-hydrolase [Hirschia baltica]ACT58872.1 beta-lactamase domain protein [Hirschia baltica ATCC 49814]
MPKSAEGALTSEEAIAADKARKEEFFGKTGRVKLDYPFEEHPEPGEVTEVAPGILWVAMPLPIKGLDWINLWLIEEEDGWTLVDTGMSMEETRNHWEKVFDNHLKGKPITRVIGTHLHPDHIGLAGWVTRKFDCELWMSQAEYVFCRMLVADTGRAAPPEGIKFYTQAGWDADMLDHYTKKFGFFGQMVWPLPEAFRRLQDKDVLSIGGRDWRIIVGNGHSPEHVCLYCEELNVLISGDQLLPRISSNVSVYPTEPEADPLTDWLDSCAKLIKEVPADVLVLPAHNRPFKGAHQRLTNLIEGHQRQIERLWNKLKEPATTLDVFGTLFFRKIGKGDYFTATGEAVAHLNYLYLRGRVSRTLVDGVYRYQAKPNDDGT